jgi:hypothetical protein
MWTGAVAGWAAVGIPLAHRSEGVIRSGQAGNWRAWRGVAIGTATDIGLSRLGGRAVFSPIAGRTIRGGYRGYKPFYHAAMYCRHCWRRAQYIGIGRTSRQLSSYGIGSYVGYRR